MHSCSLRRPDLEMEEPHRKHSGTLAVRIRSALHTCRNRLEVTMHWAMQMQFAPASVLEEIARTTSEKARPVNEALPERTALRPFPVLPADRLALAIALSHNHSLARLTCRGECIEIH
jgi:hypothetical protein